MPSLRAQHVSFSFGFDPLFHDVSFHLTEGWCGLVGPNGGGKSTLLELLAGLRAPEEGFVSVEPRTARIVLCPQRIDEPMAAGASSPALLRWAGHLRLDEHDLARWPTLSPGERKRWQIAHALSSEPEVLLLDEPTNHLDAWATKLLASTLGTFRGIGLVVSHDRALLDSLTSSTLRLTRGAAEWREGNYSQAHSDWEREELAARTHQAETRRKLEATQRRLTAERARLDASSAQRSTRARMKSRHDSDARTLGANFSAEMAERQHAKALRRTHERTARLQSQVEHLEHWPEARALFLKDAPCPRPLVASLRGALTVGERTLLREVHLDLARERHVAIVGPNGTGKTTLLTRLLDETTLPAERVLFLPQELTTDEVDDALTRLEHLEPAARGHVLQLVDALGTRPEQLLRTTRPSPGEARKLHLALGLGHEVWLAVLDEPTNHLDLPSIERLEAALKAYPGALVISTHDQHLAQAVADETWSTTNGVLARIH